MTTSRRLTLAAAAVVLGLSACGSSTASTGGAAAKGAKPAVIHVAGATAKRAAGSATAASGRNATPADVAAADGAPVPELGIAPTTFTYDGTLPALDTLGPAWSFAPGAKPSTQEIQRLAAAFGLNGPVTQAPTDQGGGWTVGASDGSAPGLTVSDSATLDWWFTAGPEVGGTSTATDCGIVATDAPATAPGAVVAPAPAPAPVPATSVVGSDGSTGGGQPGCPPTTTATPEGVPTADAAKAAAITLLRAAGIDLAQYRLDAQSDPYGAYVTANLVLGGLPSPISIGIAYGAHGAITSANGLLATPTRVADYPRVGAATGLKRLQDQSGRWLGYGYAGISMSGASVKDAAPGGVASSSGSVAGQAAPSVVGGAAVAIPEPAPLPPGTVCAATAPVTAVPVGAKGVGAGDELTTTTAPAATASGGAATNPAGSVTIEDPCAIPVPGPAPEPVTIALTGVTASLTEIWAADGTVWVLPAYTFTTADGGEYVVPAVEDAYLQLDEATTPPADSVVPAEAPSPAPIAATTSGG